MFHHDLYHRPREGAVTPWRDLWFLFYASILHNKMSHILDLLDDVIEQTTFSTIGAQLLLSFNVSRILEISDRSFNS